jgi:sulfate transport system ATP-binding protein
MHEGRIEQAGEPTELYERPATDFVHGFLGPTTMFKGVSVRPHDLELVPASEGAIEGTVQSIMELGFEVQVTVALSDGTAPWVQMSRNEFRNLHVEIGSLVSIRERD